jgi:FAD/FMN-containing dehydrogenase
MSPQHPSLDEGALRAAHVARARAAAEALRQAAGHAPLALAKSTSNLFRHREKAARQRLDLRALNQVIGFDTAAGWVQAEGLTTFEDLVAFTLPRGVMPAVVPQLKTITVGGAVAGVGIEATSFRHGLVHETMTALEVLLPHGEIVHCTADNEHADLFHGFPNAYGTLGYALSVRLRTQATRPFVHVQHRRFSDPRAFFDAMARECGRQGFPDAPDFVDGVLFGPHEQVLSLARFVPEAAQASDYTGLDIYHESLRRRDDDTLTTAGYLWRWDTDWFWCSRRFGLQHRWLRRLLGARHLNSRTYTRWMRWNARWRVTQRLDAWLHRHHESVVQDVDIPIAHALAFLDFLRSEIGIWPVWVCPVRGSEPPRFPLYPLPAGLSVNFGFWDVVAVPAQQARDHLNRRVEDMVLRLGGIKSLYSDSFFEREAFDRAYGMAQYARLKARYDPLGRAPHLYDTCVRRA